MSGFIEEHAPSAQFMRENTAVATSFGFCDHFKSAPQAAAQLNNFPEFLADVENHEKRRVEPSV